jgi:nucleoside phosphorylase
LDRANVTLSDGSPALDGNAAVVLSFFDPGGIKHGVFDRNFLLKNLIRKTAKEVEQVELDAILTQLVGRGLIECIAWPAVSPSERVADEEASKEHFVTTALGKKAARLCRVLSGEATGVFGWEFGGTATSGQPLEDLIVLACYVGESDFDHLDIACCCATSEEIEASVTRLEERKLVSRTSDRKIRLLPAGEARGAQLQKVESQKFVNKLASELSAGLSAAIDGSNDSAEALVTDSYDVAIICALRNPELEHVTRTGKDGWQDLPSSSDDPNSYSSTTYVTERGKRLRVIAGSPTQMGMPASAILTTKMILRFKPKIVVMVGIAAGAKSGEQHFGDVLAPDCTFDYGSGKVRLDDSVIRFAPDPNPVNISARLRDRLKAWSSARTQLDEIYRDWPARKPRWVLNLHVGTLASGSAVVDARAPVEEIASHWRKLMGIEMEAYGVHLACHMAVEPSPMFLCMKSICDFADKKDDSWQEYAAYTASQLCHRFLTAEWENLFRDKRR